MIDTKGRICTVGYSRGDVLRGFLMGPASDADLPRGWKGMEVWTERAREAWRRWWLAKGYQLRKVTVNWEA
jgi:hypothetical protein